MKDYKVTGFGATVIEDKSGNRGHIFINEIERKITHADISHKKDITAQVKIFVY